jgi:hypothetical protein
MNHASGFVKVVGILSLLVLSTLAVAQKMEATSNTIALKIGTQTDAAAGMQAEIMVTLESLGIYTLPKYYALIIGVSEYQYTGPGLQNLEMPVKDAEELYSLLIGRYAFEPANVMLLKNPTHEDIVNQFEHLAEAVKEKDNLLIFYAGHGVYDKAKDFGYWLPANAKTTSRSAWISNSLIKDYIGAIKAKHILLLTDACFGGSIFKTRSSASSTIMHFNEAYKNNSRKALTSGNLSEVPDKSVFLKFLLKTLNENNDVFLPASALFSRIYEPVINNAVTTPRFGVVQGTGDEGGDFVFIRKN